MMATATALRARGDTYAMDATFVWRATLAMIVLFAFIRWPWTERALIAPLTAAQASAARYIGAPEAPNVTVTTACGGADVLAVCLGVVLAFPSSIRRRAVGAIGAIALILAVNTARLALLFTAAPRPALFDMLHIWVLPIALGAVAFGYVGWWTQHGSRAPRAAGGATRFGAVAFVLVVTHLLMAPTITTLPAVTSVCETIATAAAAVMRAFGSEGLAAGARLSTPHGAFDVTGECLFTAMIPLYVAWIVTSRTGWRRIGGLVAALPLFFSLGIVRVLSLALPAASDGSAIWLVHGFFQIACAAVVIGVLAERGRAVTALAVAILAGLCVGALWSSLIERVAAARPHVDLQGAGVVLPFIASGMFAGLCAGHTRPGMSRGRIAAAAAALVFIVTAAAIMFAALGSPQQEAPTLTLRLFAIASPLSLVAAGRALERRRSVAATTAGDPAYVDFWHDVGATFPDLGGAVSTRLYRDDEIALLTASVGDLRGRRVLKTDLWDEARNTRILQWMASEGARVYGVDLSRPTIVEARREFGSQPHAFSCADVRRLPFADASFDVVYSMGTVEHFDETEAALAELARVLTPGGRLILGVPNRHDPFLRPLAVAALHRLRLYDYGYEKSYSRRTVNRMLTRSGLDVAHQSGVLFMPGLLRMAELWLWTRHRRAAIIARPFVECFARLSRRWPRLRRYGYLIATVGIRPITPTHTLKDSIVWPE